MGRAKEEVSGPTAGLTVGSKGDFRVSGRRNWVSKACQLRWGAVVDRVGRKGGCLRGMGSRVARDPSRHWNSVVRLECGQRSGVQTQVC